MKLEIYRKDLQKTFTKYGDTFTQIAHNSNLNTYLYERTDSEGKNNGYEIIKPKKVKNPDGSIVYVYPTEREWGYGRALTTRNKDKAFQYLNNGLERLED